MKRASLLVHEFVEYIPNDLEEGKLYVSMSFTTVVHRCCCGCGNEVVTPLSPTDWQLTFDGESISLHPSIGNWSFPCQSHYWVTRNQVKWAPRWSQDRINTGRSRDAMSKERQFNAGNKLTPEDSTNRHGNLVESKSKVNPWRKLKKWLFR